MSKTQMDIRSDILMLLERIVDIDMRSISDDDELRDYGLNSSTILRLMIDIEQSFNICFEDDDFDWRHYRTLGTLVWFVQKKLKMNENDD